jgi:hypothetical protein
MNNNALIKLLAIKDNNHEGHEDHAAANAEHASQYARHSSTTKQNQNID